MPNLVLSEYYTATNADVPRLPWLLREVPEQVLVRELWLDSYTPLLTMAAEPFGVIEEDEHFVLHGQDRATDAPAKLRITNTMSFPNLLQYCNGRYCKWGDSSFSLILLLPKSHQP